MPVSNKALSELGWTPWFEESFASWQTKNCFPGRVIGMHRDIYTVRTGTGQLTARVTGRFVHLAQSKGDYPAVGDWVALELKSNQAMIKAVLPRKSQFARKVPIRGGRKIKNGIIVGGSTEEQIIAANIDTVFIVTGLDQNFEPRRIERYLTVSVNSGAEPVIVLNKADLHDNLDFFLRQLEEITDNVPVHGVSAETGLNMDCLDSYMQSGSTVVFIGSSGVGKSALTNRLLGQELLKTSYVSNSTGKGRHTTTSSQVVFHPSGCLIIDTPGLRELQLWCDEDAVANTFEDIIELESQCRFNDCSHTKEPGCAIQRALDTGVLSADRLKSYITQIQELSRLEARKKQLEVRAGRKKRY